MRTLVVFALVVVGGCANKMETAWQITHAIDGLQTLQIAKSDCFYEANWFTQQQIGKHPSEEAVVVWWAAHAMGHYMVTRWLEPYPKWQKAWQSVTLANSAYYVVNNHRIGLRPLSHECG
jgi:hypothetical protein